MEYYDETVSILQTCEDVRVPQRPTDLTLRTSGLDCYLLLLTSQCPSKHGPSPDYLVIPLLTSPSKKRRCLCQTYHYNPSSVTSCVT